MIDVGAGVPLVLVPGIQGRWEWMAPSIDALARECRVITASLPGEPGVNAGFDADADFDVFVRHLDDVLDASGVADVILCGVSFGGLIALRYAAMRSHRVRGLILVSTPGPSWRVEPRGRLRARKGADARRDRRERPRPGRTVRGKHEISRPDPRVEL